MFFRICYEESNVEVSRLCWQREEISESIRRCGLDDSTITTPQASGTSIKADWGIHRSAPLERLRRVFYSYPATNPFVVCAAAPGAVWPASSGAAREVVGLAAA